MSPRSVAMALLVLIALILATVGGTPAQSGPIKIGFITDLTGPAAQAAKDMVNGITMYLDEIGSQMAGRKVELIVEDSQGRPDAAVTKLRKVVEHDRVQLVAGVLFGHIGYAMAPKVEEYKIPALFTVTAADDLTQRQKYRWVIRTGWASSQPSHPFGEYVAKTLGHRKVAVIASDYAFGWEVVGGFQRTFEENGGQVIPEALGAPRRDGPRALHRQDPA
jgi:branched-chain amino acid transport system substrate-binding protein